LACEANIWISLIHEKNEDFEAVLQWQIDINKLKKLL
jgi:hypothetical protein